MTPARRQADRWELDALLEQLARLRIAGARNHASEVAFVRDAAGKRDNAVAVEDRRDYGHVHRVRHAR